MDTEDNKLKMTPLGAGQEVGRSCMILEYRGKTIMFDCGLHPARSGKLQLPYFENIKSQYIDLLLVTHFHLDHCGSLPYFTEQTEFKIGKIYMTAPTKAIYNLNLSDYVKVSSGENKLFDKKDLDESMKKIEIIDYHQDLEFNGIRFTCFNAGHVLGAAMFLVDICGVKILYTGDYSREDDRHIHPAEIPNINVDILCVESTFGANNHQPRAQREIKFKDTVHKIVSNGGKCLLPVFVSGRAQELLLILDEYWDQNDEIQHIPIFYASSLASKCMNVFETYTNMMGPYVKQKFKEGINPFLFKYVQHLEKMEDDFDEKNKACVMMASPGMLQNGLSRTCFEKWCHDEKNGVIITGYCVDGTLAKEILDRPRIIKKLDGTEVERKIEVEKIIFCAHSDFAQTTDYIKKLKPKNIVLVHGEKNEASNLKQRLEELFKDIRVESPENRTEVVFEFNPRNEINAFGSLAKDIIDLRIGMVQEEITNQKDDKQISGEQNTGSIVDEKKEEQKQGSEELAPVNQVRTFQFDGYILKESENKFIIFKDTDISTILNIPQGKITQKIKVPFAGSLDLVLFLIKMVFSQDLATDSTKHKMTIEAKSDMIILNNQISIRKLPNNTHLQFDWVSSKKNDIITDHLSFLFSQIPSESECDVFHEFKDNIAKKASFLLQEAFPGSRIQEHENQRLTLAIIEPPASDDEEEIVKKEIEIDFSHERYHIKSNDQEFLENVQKILEPYLAGGQAQGEE